MIARLKAVFRFVLLSGLFLLELALVAEFYIAPQFQSHEYTPHPAIALEMETVFSRHPWLRIIPIAWLALFLFGNAGLILMIWKAFKNFQIETRND